jgi:chaperonin GroES
MLFDYRTWLIFRISWSFCQYKLSTLNEDLTTLLFLGGLTLLVQNSISFAAPLTGLILSFTKKINTIMAKKLAILPIAGTKNRVFVKPAPAEERTSGGIIIPDTAKEKPQRGEVVAISEIDEDGKKPVIKIGDVVLYGKYAGTEISYEGQDFLSMRESDIIAKL